MKDASQYPVTFPYNATSSPYSPSSPHRGEDRAMPLNTPVVVNGKTIGLAGTTGHSTGVHTHTQKVQNGQVVHPKGGGFKVPSPAVVYDTGYRNDIGNYVRYRDADGVEWSIFHFNKVNVKVGDKLEGVVMVTRKAVRDLFRHFLGKDPSETDYNQNVGKVEYDRLRTALASGDIYAKRVEAAKNGTLNTVNHLPETLRTNYKPSDGTVLSPGRYVVK